MMALLTIAVIVLGATGLCVVAILAHVHNRQLRFNERQIEAISTETAEKAARYAGQVERLEQRMRVLERIATDRGIAVGDEIDRLRARPLH